MPWKSLSTTSPLYPFRAACAGTNRLNLTDKLISRPTVAKLPPASVSHAEEQDAVLSGMTRSLHRRLSGLNLSPVIRTANVQRRVA